MEIAQLVLTLLVRAAQEIPDIIAAINAGDDDAEERLRVWLENQEDLQAEVQRTKAIVDAAKGRLGG